jgi:type I restriction enzyme S subunit
MENKRRHSMVGSSALKKSEFEPHIVELPEDDVKWCTVSLNDVLKANVRLEASVYDINGKHAREVLDRCIYKSLPLIGEHGFTTAYSCGRFKRIWLPYSDLPIYQPSTIMDLNPAPDGYLSGLTKTNIAALRVRKGQILVTCSGTIGKVSLVSKTLNNKIFSHDLIRLNTKNLNNSGYVYAFLRSKIGNILLQSNKYGAVITHIEPEHLADIPVPNPPENIKKKIHGFIIHSFDLREESNELITKATDLLISELNLPPVHEIKTKRFNNRIDVDNYSVKLSNLDRRLDGSYHIPLAKAIAEHLRKYAEELTTIGDKRISKEIILPGRFKRVYVEEGQGQVFFSGKNISELDPSDKKYLSFARHANRIKQQLTIKHQMILITCSGSVGKVAIVPKHWDNWAMTHDIIRLVPQVDLCGYLYIWLQSAYAKKLIQAMQYGSVVPHVEDEHIRNVVVPLLKNKSTQKEINEIALVMNKKRYEAYLLEQQAMKILNDEVIYAR